jgi:iron complex outermembrane receptor protein
LIPDVFEEDRNTFDLELEHHFAIWDRHEVVYGANYRVSADEIGNLGPTLAFLPDEQTNHLVSGYVQDTIQLMPEVLSITLGTKLEYNTFSGFEVQPTGRFAITPGHDQTIWGAISRAVRTPTRIDQDLVAPNPSSGNRAFLVANPDFDSEELIAYELGYRIKPAANLAVDIAVYYNDYDNLRSVEPVRPNSRVVQLGNKLMGESYGGELSVKWRPLDWWELNGSVTCLNTDFHRTADSGDTSNGSAEGNDPDRMFVLRSAIDLPQNVRFDSIFRYVSELPQPATPAYTELDLRLAWSPIEQLEIAIVGRNLLDEAHPEFRQTVTHEVRRSVFGTIRWSF